ncbi:hypothetical protein [Rhodococcus jostii]
MTSSPASGCGSCATVKDHETFRGQYQTVVTRAKLEDLEPAV